MVAPLTAVEWKKLVLAKVGTIGAPKVAPLLDLLWRRHGDKSTDELRFNYVFIECVDILLGGNWQNYRVRTQAGEVLDFDTPFANLIKLAERAQAYIDAALSSTVEQAVVGELEAVTPITPLPGYPNPASGYYMGDITSYPLRWWVAA